MLEEFGGGIELTTLAAIPSGSGLGTSSIMGAVLVSVISRMTGRKLSPRELFHAVLKLEQELTTGGGWQDQVGGVVGGVKVIRTEPGMVPNPLIHFVPADTLDPRTNGGQTLLYYTGLRRLAKNILADVVGSYLSRDRGAMNVLSELHAFPPLMAEAMSQKSVERFGRLLDDAWGLKKALDPESTTPLIEGVLDQVARHVFGATLLGAGGGGFLLLVCRSAGDAGKVRDRLTRKPPNPRARFFDFDVNAEGLVVTVS
jgi:galactokinase/mevalonate kinase-like predicted kinase